MKKINLTGKWKLIENDVQEKPSRKVDKPAFDKKCVLHTNVPGDVNATLLEYGKIPDPHYDVQAKQCYWVTSKEWWYQFDFNLEHPVKNETDLCLTRVDGHADIWINNQYLGEMKNAFRELRFKVNKYLKKQNRITVRFKSIDNILGGPRLDELAGWKSRRAFIRKPQFSFGWDWSLPLPSIGLAGKVWLEVKDKYSLSDVFVKPYNSGRLDCFFEVNDNTAKEQYDINITVNGQEKVKKSISRTGYKSYTTLYIDNPKLWYPNGFGGQPIYEYSIELIVDGKTVNCQNGKFAFREVRINEKPFTGDAGPGFSFEFEINGQPIFCKGANWIPLELWPGTVKPEQYKFYLKKVKEANFNMIRVWGGGIYEQDIFYSLCDEMGIMVWQDFMFASTGYPVEQLKNEIIKEAQYQIKRLRTHPCIVMWCGCNEDIYSWSYRKQEQNSTQADQGVYTEQEKRWEINRLKNDPELYTMILRGLVSKYGLGVPYIESSPQSHDDYGNTPNSGNSHLSCWKYMLFEQKANNGDFREYFNDVCSFNSEFCIQGPCNENAFRRFMAPENLWPPNEAWIYHIQRGHKNLPHYKQTIQIASSLFGKIDSLKEYVKYGRATHAEMMRCEFESARRDRPNNGGTMVWMFNDCWPTSNWSIIDYYRQPKPAYYAAKRACTPLLPIILERDGIIEFFFSNESNKAQKVKVVFGLKTLHNKKIWNLKREYYVEENSTLKFKQIDTRDKFNNENYLFIKASYSVDNETYTLPEVSYFPNGWKDIKWPNPKLRYEFVQQERTKTGWKTKIHIETDAFCRMCDIEYTSQQNLYFSDNYFDLSAGDDRIITAYSKERLKADHLHLSHWNNI